MILFLVLGLASCTASHNAQTKPENNDRSRKWSLEFREANPPRWKERDYDYYIWTPKAVYLVGEPIPLYIEVVARESFGPSIPNPIFLHEAGYHVNAVKDRKIDLFICSKKVSFTCTRYIDETPFYEGDYIVAADEIPFRLHGNFVMPRRGTDGWWRVDLEPGDCYVMKINDITELWYMHLMDPEFDPRGYYQVQFECSNIIEFKIR